MAGKLLGCQSEDMRVHTCCKRRTVRACIVRGFISPSRQPIPSVLAGLNTSIGSEWRSIVCVPSRNFRPSCVCVCVKSCASSYFEYLHESGTRVCAARPPRSRRRGTPAHVKLAFQMNNSPGFWTRSWLGRFVFVPHYTSLQLIDSSYSKLIVE